LGEAGNSSKLKFGILGPVAVWTNDPGCDEAVQQALSENKARGTLVALLLRANQFVTQAQLSQLLWDAPPDSARPNIRTYVAQVRKALECTDQNTSRLSSIKRGAQTEGGSYRLRIDPMELDADLFVRLVRHAREESRAGAVADAASTLRH
jgi:DNA-binding SARP family transcriptional activator